MIRTLTLAALAASMLSAPISAQTVDTLDRRLNNLEKEVRAVQRKVFPGANERFFEPEIAPPAQADGFGVPAATPSTVVTDRIDALEAQLSTLTGQMEENSFKLRQLEENFTRFENDMKFRLETLEGSGGTLVDGDAPADGPKAQYDAAYQLYTSKDWAAAQGAFGEFLEANPTHELASNAGYWMGRALLQQGQPVQAVQAFLSNYQDRRDGNRAADSLLWVGKALMQIDPPRTAQACQAYDRLEDEYSGKQSDEVATGLVEARLAASCS